jgi:hypothetical protein
MLQVEVVEKNGKKNYIQYTFSMLCNIVKLKRPNTYISEVVYSAIMNGLPNMKITELLTVLFQTH